MLEIKQTDTYRKWECKLRDQRGNEVIILLCGGDKDTQQSDINTALRLASEWEAL